MPLLLTDLWLIGFLAGMVFTGWIARRDLAEANGRAGYFRAVAGEMYARSCRLALELEQAKARNRELETEGEEWKNA